MEPLLVLDAVESYYGENHILKAVSLTVGAGETVALLGRNGAGKTTTLKSIVGWVAPRAGSITLAGEQLAGSDMMTIARKGVALVPEERRIFTNLTVADNLRIAQITARRPGWSLERVYERFPRLRERLANKGDEISGGEKQMLAIARALVQDVRVLLLDEPTEGLAPVIIQQIGKTIRALKERGFTILLVEQNFRFASTVADRYYVMEHGRIIDQFANSELDANVEKLHDYLGV
jgi:branched-chain amino acid transport system ATP-binding protein